MTDHDALLAAICAAPDEDTPRLALADWLDEHDRHAQAGFVRTQVELARTPPWEPVAVACRWRTPDLVTGKPFRDTLPKVDGFHTSWPHEPFRRGLGWRLNLAAPAVWDQIEPRFLGRVPIGAMHLSGATLDDWVRFAASAVVPFLRELHFVSNPIEPLRVLRDTPAALGVTDIYFDRAGGAGMPVVVEDLFQSPLGRAVRGLHFHVGYESLLDLIESLHTGPGLERLSFSVMGLTREHVRRLCDGPALGRLVELNVSDEPFGNDGLRALAGSLPASLQMLKLSSAGGQADGLEALTASPNVASLRRLDLSRNPLAPRAARVLAASRALAGLRSLDLHGCRLGDKGTRRLPRAKFWPNLVELDLRGNVISPFGIQGLLDAEVPRDLAALVLDGEQLGHETRTELRRKYGERVVFTA
ncbi:leucine-rich repeat-containing protein typical subtype : Putative Leucine-rich repeat-containing protein typical subtype OS=Nitrospina gracilis (strain 3/211) GN=NITGR_170119 PE=4 SV=1: LRR_6: LRR_7: LRR_6 [Gemmataceae bacterium]|nr:leucine-rich repeat-containing protein typical subtype : Putative Leucine-rich repeat-containing protein typical subtype OS=Nitrospina gracilis (strain 3/211) GN=NITGR_170119 PE=4 SV=1: LRR_6: LRR_7: LRR_6 [Gemmataceae bacterium]VTU00396.1 leucine-rich repeat-containing protein typical subtype : Putative Leucine-rich repeat-containing protein typical subtype OS=Nitrospina gracilis (strain 3/211) GN=NITGR_170119 PE=4 SV=1: LRR_6: LRR_7: LRR_6 [Gemmataceae bacterium]